MTPENWAYIYSQLTDSMYPTVLRVSNPRQGKILFELGIYGGTDLIIQYRNRVIIERRNGTFYFQRLWQMLRNMLLHSRLTSSDFRMQVNGAQLPIHCFLTFSYAIVRCKFYLLHLFYFTLSQVLNCFKKQGKWQNINLECEGIQLLVFN